MKEACYTHLDLGFCSEVGVRKLFSLTEGRLDDLEVIDVAQVIPDRLVRVSLLCGTSHVCDDVRRAIDRSLVGDGAFPGETIDAGGSRL